MNIEYSVIIRTTGRAGEKYQALLDSIDHLEPKPAQIIVVLPEGYDLPKERLGWETFYFSRKGMVIQRMYGIEKCKTKYALICDDDMAFPADFVRKLYRPIAEGICRITAGPLYSLLPAPGMTAVLCTLLGSAPATVFHRDRYTSVLRTSGYSYNRGLDAAGDKLYEAQSLSWGCFFAEIDAIQEIGFQEETWVDAHGYAALDDQTMFYKGWLRGIRACVVPDALYEHLDAGTSTKSSVEVPRYAMSFNRVVFWKRFLLEQQKNGLCRVWTWLCFGYFLCCNGLYDCLTLCIKRDMRRFRAKYRGLRDGWRYTRSPEYRGLPPVR